VIKSIIGILISIIVLLIGIIINITENFSTDAYWVGIVLMFLGAISTVIFIIGKLKNWF